MESQWAFEGRRFLLGVESMLKLHLPQVKQELGSIGLVKGNLLFHGFLKQGIQIRKL